MLSSSGASRPLEILETGKQRLDRFGKLLRGERQSATAGGGRRGRAAAGDAPRRPWGMLDEVRSTRNRRGYETMVGGGGLDDASDDDDDDDERVPAWASEQSEGEGEFYSADEGGQPDESFGVTVDDDSLVGSEVNDTATTLVVGGAQPLPRVNAYLEQSRRAQARRETARAALTARRGGVDLRMSRHGAADDASDIQSVAIAPGGARPVPALPPAPVACRAPPRARKPPAPTWEGDTVVGAPLTSRSSPPRPAAAADDDDDAVAGWPALPSSVASHVGARIAA